MRVLHVHSGNIYGGVETLLTTLARCRDLNREMETHYALCFEGRLSEELISAQAPVHCIGSVRIRRPLTVLRARLRLRSLFRRIRFDIAICHSAWSQALFGPMVQAAGIPLAFWLHSKTEATHWLERWARLTRPDVAICNSRFTAASLQQLYPDVRAEVIHCPVTPPELNPAHERAAKRAEMQTPQDAVVIIQASRMEPWKGQSLHLEALSLLKDVPSWVCWQVGGAQQPGELEFLSSLKETAVRHGIADRVRFLSHRSDVPALLAAADIYCQPNNEPEPFGIAFIEALQAKLPVVTTELGGASEILDGSCGLLIKPKDARTLAQSLRLLIEDGNLRANLGANGPGRARELCDPAAQIDRLNRLLSSAARRANIKTIKQEVELA